MSEIATFVSIFIAIAFVGWHLGGHTGVCGEIERRKKLIKKGLMRREDLWKR